ncbi:MAG: hypothetical protein BroJett015_35440 [Chloroflexota bacterium]|nr:hypothetical protein [Chloroflexota bacterium]GIK57881.1 MAG: hypothetical protein BroJett015_35440 [Chloroflexota bacterium]
MEFRLWQMPVMGARGRGKFKMDLRQFRLLLIIGGPVCGKVWADGFNLPDGTNLNQYEVESNWI